MAVSLLEVRRQILLNTPHIESASGSIATFNTDLSTNLTDMKIHFHPVQEGTGDPSPDNVRPITGWDGMTVTRCGKNWIDQNFLRDASNYKNAGFHGYQYTDWIYLPANTSFVFSWDNVGGINKIPCLLYVANANRYIVYNERDARLSSFMTNSEGSIRFGINKQSYATIQDALDAIFNTANLQLELGSTATDYEPYTAVEIPISFPQTIYGGYVDLVKGEVVETHLEVGLDGSESWAISSSNDNNVVFWCNNPVSVKPVNQHYEICSYFVMHGQAHAVRDDLVNRFIWGSATGRIYIQVAKTLASTVQEFKDYLAEQQTLNTPVRIVAIYATPNTYPLTPQTIKALKGINNIWSDTNGDIEVKFWKH